MSARIINFEKCCKHQFTVFVESIMYLQPEAYIADCDSEYGQIMSDDAIIQTISLMVHGNICNTQSEFGEILKNHKLILPKDLIATAFSSIPQINI